MTTNFEIFQEIVADALKAFGFEHNEEWVVVKDVRFVKYLIKINNSNLSRLNQVAWDIKELAEANGCSDVFGCQLHQGCTLSFYDMIVFDL